MELDRGSIERRNFSTARRGYEPTEVDAHLRSVADAVEELREEHRTELSEHRTSLSTAAAERVRIILDAAEQSAEDIRRTAEQEAEGVVADARRRGEEAQQRAEQEAADHVDNVERQADLLFQRADRLQSELDDVLERLRTAAGGLIDNLRSESGDLRSDLDALKGELADARGTSSLAAGAAVVDEPEPEPAFDEPAFPEPAADADFDAPAEEEERAELTAVAAPRLDDEPVTAEPELEEAAEPAAEEPVEAPVAEEAEPGDAGAGEGDGAEGARLIALNMALNGTPREETAEYLERTFGLRNERLLDDVYARVQRS